MQKRRKRKNIYSGSYQQPNRRNPNARRIKSALYNALHKIVLAITAALHSVASLFGAPKKSQSQTLNAPVALDAQGVALPIENNYPTSRHVRRTPLQRALDVGLLLLVAASFAFLGWALLFSDDSVPVYVTQNEQTQLIYTKAETVEELFTRNGLTLNEGDTLDISMDEPVYENMSISVTNAFPVAIASGGDVQILRMQEGSVGDALALAGITYDANDELTSLSFEDVYAGMHIQHIAVEVEYETKEQAIPYKEEIVKDQSRYTTSADVIKVEGKDGLRRTVRRLIYRDGILSSREVMNQITLEEAINQVRIVGTKTRYQTNFQGDDRLWKDKPTASQIKKTLVASEITAYTHTGKRTATGRWPKIGYVAVNPNIIPYGTKLYIPGYGYCTAQDTGAFRHEQNGTKNQIDIFLNTESECKKWGRKRNIEIYILK